jgi:O-antigen ligase
VLIILSVFCVGTVYSVGDRTQIIAGLWKMSKIGMVLLLLPFLQEDRWRHRMLTAFLTAMGITLFLALIKTYTSWFIIPSRHTLACVFKNHIDTNLLMAFSAFICAHLFIKHRRTGLSILTLGMIYYIFFMSEGRSGYVIAIALWCLWGWQRLGSWRRQSISILLLCGLITITTYTTSPFETRVVQAIHEMDILTQPTTGPVTTSVGLRITFVEQAWTLWKTRPWFGWGTGSFAKAYKASLQDATSIRTDNPHNEYLHILCEVGLVGFLIILGSWGVIFYQGLKSPIFERYLLQGLFASLGLGCLANSWWLDFTSGYFLVFLLAFVFSGKTPCSSRSS